MAENSGIEWTDHTFNPWWGCVKISPACTHCYAATFAQRFGLEWGPNARRRFFGEKHWSEPLKWNAKAEREGVRRRVFCASMADVFEQLPPEHPDAEAMEAARQRLWALIRETPALDWLLLTKRPENASEPAPADWGYEGWPANVWLGTTVENQEQAARRIPFLLRAHARVRFLSCEPLLGPVDLTLVGHPCGWVNALTGQVFDGDDGNPVGGFGGPSISWVIAGGESGSGSRPTDPKWVYSLRDQCLAAQKAFFFKQWGDLVPLGEHTCTYTPEQYTNAAVFGGLSFVRVGKKAAGRLLDGQEWSQFPTPMETLTR